MTIDGDTMSQDIVTVRHRDSMKQDKVAVKELEAFLREQITSWKRA